MGDLYLKPQRGSSNLLRGLSPNIWSQAPLVQINSGAIDEGFGFIDDFLTFPEANAEIPWLSTQSTSGTSALDDAKGGVLKIDSGGPTQHKGMNLQYGVGEQFLANANAKIYYEARIKLSTLSGPKVQAFVGLAQEITAVIASGANATANHIGFEFLNTTDIKLVTENGGSRTASASSLATLVDGTYVKLGFVVDGVSKITPYVNGVAGDAITTNVAASELCPTLVCQTDGTVRPVMYVDWVPCYQAEQIAN